MGLVRFLKKIFFKLKILFRTNIKASSNDYVLKKGATYLLTFANNTCDTENISFSVLFFEKDSDRIWD